MMAQVTFPARCAVAVVCGETLVSQVYPASIPVGVFIDDAIELLDEDLRRRGVSGLDHDRVYELQRTNGSRLDASRSLDELGVEDGATLVLALAEDGASFEPQYESLSTALARIGASLFSPVTAASAARAAGLILSAVVLTVIALSAYVRTGGESSVPGIVCLSLGVTLGIGTFWVRKWWPQRGDLLSMLAWPVVPAAAAGAAMAAPGALTAAHLFIAAMATVVLAPVAESIARTSLTVAAAIVTVSVFGLLASATRMAAAVPAQRLGICALVGLLILAAAAPTIALWVARIRPPHFGSITGRDLFRRDDGMPVDAVVPVDEDFDTEPGSDTTHSGAGRSGADPDTTPRGDAIGRAARRANGVLTGICAAIAIMLPVAVWNTVAPGRPRSGAAALLSLLFALIFIIRARSFSDRDQATALVLGSAAAMCAGVARYVTHGGGSAAALLCGATALAGFAAAAMAAALLVPATRFTPLVRMLTEWLELVAITVALPMAAWIVGLFHWVRMR